MYVCICNNLYELHNSKDDTVEIWNSQSCTYQAQLNIHANLDDEIAGGSLDKVRVHRQMLLDPMNSQGTTNSSSIIGSGDKSMNGIDSSGGSSIGRNGSARLRMS